MGIGHKEGRALVVDHLNHNTLDNRKCNLRCVSQRENCRNRQKPGTSRYPGVYWDKTKHKWTAKAADEHGVVRQIGRFTDEGDAAAAYRRFCEEHNLG